MTAISLYRSGLRGVAAAVQRYIYQLPMFSAGQRKELTVPRGSAEASDPSGARAALAGLTDLCKRAQAEVADKVPIMKQVFPDPGATLKLLIQRLFADRIQVCLILFSTLLTIANEQSNKCHILHANCINEIDVIASCGRA